VSSYLISDAATHHTSKKTGARHKITTEKAVWEPNYVKMF
jgi:hypothetical protein